MFLCSGFASGGSYAHTVNGANYICLPSDPILKSPAPGNHRGRLYGLKYQNPFPPVADNNEVPCALCISPKCAVFMLPARDKCYDGWTTDGSLQNITEVIIVEQSMCVLTVTLKMWVQSTAGSPLCFIPFTPCVGQYRVKSTLTQI